MQHARISLLAAGAVLLLRSHVGSAEVPDTCSAPHELDKYQLLRRLSFDLRQSSPMYEEYVSLESSQGVPDELVDRFVQSEGFRLGMRRYHENLLWPNVANVHMSGPANKLTPRQGKLYVVPLVARLNAVRHSPEAICNDLLQTEFDPACPGEFRPANVPVVEGVTREGYRMVAPYWDPQNPIKVCAFDAQETLSVTKGGVTIRCGTPEAQREPACGCGPNLRFCYTSAAEPTLLASFREQVGRAIDRVTTGARPYTDLLLAQDIEENGPIAYWRKHAAKNSVLNLTYNVPGADESPNDMDFTDMTWKVNSRSPLHAGILTTPGYLLRFQTNRSRANRFRVAFMGEYFVPASKLEPQASCSDDSADLTQRCNCQYCHQTLEPLAAHFSNFSEAGSAPLADRLAFPRSRPDCILGGGAKDRTFCDRFYVTGSDEPHAGSLRAYQFAAEHDDYPDSIEKGPRKLAEAIIADGTFARTTVRYLYTRLVKQDLRIEGEHAEDRPLLTRLSQGFQDVQYSFPWLVKQIVSLPEYRSVR